MLFSHASGLRRSNYYDDHWQAIIIVSAYHSNSQTVTQAKQLSASQLGPLARPGPDSEAAAGNCHRRIFVDTDARAGVSAIGA